MSCYIRHLEFILERLGWENNQENRKRLDLKIRKALRMEDRHCPEIWVEVKKILESEEGVESLVARISN